ncbi:hypothetical protein ACIA03_00120 [Nocardioides sp. NPDC051685]|uniref:hypothetical protein n=1 Tax=Nocardioides sp. NPDC051685 TaxID=3364334 RepID=UPI0037A2C087
MTAANDREELVSLVAYLMSAEGTEDQQNAALGRLESRVLHPRVSDLIFWPDQEGYERELTPDEVVDIALAYCPIEL